MLIGLILRLTVIFLILTVVYAILTLLNRNRHRDKLEDEYIRAETHLDKESFVDRGMEDYNHTLRAKLVLGVFIVPLAVAGLLYYLANI